MNIGYNTAFNRFEAQFSTDFQGDLAAVKTAKFKCDGPPTWTWWTAKLDALNKLRENKPTSGLTISEEAYAVYTRLSEIEKENAAAREKFKPIKEEQAKQKKQRRKEQIDQKKYVTIKIFPHPDDPWGDGVTKEDLPPMPPYENENKPEPHFGPWCVYCRAPVFFFEKQEPPTCLWCEKQLDEVFKNSA